MTRGELESLKALRAEIKQLAEDSTHSAKRMAVDTVVGSRLHIPFDAHPITISGVDNVYIDRLHARLNRKCAELQDELERLENWIESISDPEMRVILRGTYRNALTQEEIGADLGYTGQRISQKLKRFWEEAEANEAV